MSQQDLSNALDECLRGMELGWDVEYCLSRFPSLREDLHPLLATTQALHRTRMEYPQYRPLTRRELASRLSPQGARHRWPLSMRIAAIGAAGILASSVAWPDAAPAISITAAFGWLYWWVTEFLPAKLKGKLTTSLG